MYTHRLAWTWGKIWTASRRWNGARAYGLRKITGVSFDSLARYYAAQNALSGSLKANCCDILDKHNETRRQHLPDAAAVMCLLGKLWYAHKENNKAVDCYVEALRLNPFMWDAFMGLCETGEL